MQAQKSFLEKNALMNYLMARNRDCETLLNIKDWVPYSANNLANLIEAGEAKGAIKPGQKVVDLGSGSGSSAVVWAYHGYEVTGVEIYDALAAFSRETIKQCAHRIDPSKVKILEGSYYPSNYHERRKKEIARALELEEMITIGKEHRIFGEDQAIDSQVNLLDFDIVYAYLWAAQVPSVAEVFRLYARDDAVMMLPHQRSLAKICGLKPVTAEDPHFYRKA